MSRFGAMTDSDTSERFGVGEILGVVGIGIQLAEVLANIINVYASKNKKERQSIVEVLLVRLKYIKDIIDGTHVPLPIENIVRTRLQLLVKTAKDLEDRLSHHKAVQVVKVIKKGRFKTQVETLRTGLADISEILEPYQQGTSHHQSWHHQYPPGGFPTVQHPHMLPSTSAPPQVVYNNYYINGGGGSNDYLGAISGQDQAHAFIHGHNPGFAYHQPHVVAYPPASYR